MNASILSESNQLTRLGVASGYDLIGDIHGCAHSLQRLLDQMGYKNMGGVYQHPGRQVIFLGDVLDRGPRIRDALHIVRAMVEHGSALMILGNHEFNALTYSTQTSPGSNQYLRPHTPAHSRQISETLAQFAPYPEEWSDFLAWFVTLPLFLEIQHPETKQVFRAVHACWDQPLINQHCARYGDGHIDWDFVHESAQYGSDASLIKQRLTSGIDIKLPMGMAIMSEEGYARDSFRSKFWTPDANTYGDLLFQPDPLPAQLAAAAISPEHRAQIENYGSDQPPLFVGHYWLKGQPRPLTHNLACLDYSAVKYGRLVAYRMDGEAQLQPDKFVWVYVDP